jgi:alpha-D-ribose 1-methylphosphonate 5-triphosphate synthase subunit PhnH
MLDSAFVNGFDDPVAGAQRVFRLLLDATASPGTIADVEDVLQAAPPCFDLATTAILLTLADPETSLWTAEEFTTDLAHRWLRFHTGVEVTDDQQGAAFALTSGMSGDGKLSGFALGDERYPERSTTVLVSCEALDGGSPVSLSGPGIETARLVAPRGLGTDFWTEVQRNNALFPLGVDLILTAGTTFLCIPRSTRIELKVNS